MHLPDNSESVGSISFNDLRIDPESWFELGDNQRLLQSQQLYAMAQDIERASLIDLIPETGNKGGLGLGAVIFSQSLPDLGLSLLHPGDQIGRKKCFGPVITGVIRRIEPSMIGKVFADLGLELDLFVEAHGIK